MTWPESRCSTHAPSKQSKRRRCGDQPAPAVYRPRIKQITTETRAVIQLVYAAPACSRVNGTMPASPDTNTVPCFPVWWTRTGTPAPDVHHDRECDRASGYPMILDYPKQVTTVAGYSAGTCPAATNTSIACAQHHGMPGGHRTESVHTDRRATARGHRLPDAYRRGVPYIRSTEKAGYYTGPDGKGQYLRRTGCSASRVLAPARAPTTR